MLDRRHAKPLEELLKLAEVTKQPEDAVAILDKEKHIGYAIAFVSDYSASIALFSSQGSEKRNVGNKYNSGDSSRSSGSKYTPDVLKCWYCQKEHKGGRFHCSKRKREDPDWRPNRLVIDYRMTNAKSTTATPPIPLIDDLLDRLGKARYSGTINAKSGYHQMPMKKENAEITAFVVPWGH